MGIATNNPGNVFGWDEPVHFNLTVASADKENRKANIDLYLTDFFDEEVWRDTELLQSVTYRAQSAEPVTYTVPPSPKLRGYLRLHAKMTSGTVVAERSLRLAVIPEYKLADSRFGLNHAFGWPDMLDLCRRAGLIWMRDWSPKWQDVEPKKGQFTFAETDAQIDRILKQGLKVECVLAFPSSLWSSSAGQDSAERSVVQLSQQVARPGTAARRTVGRRRATISPYGLCPARPG